MKSQRGRGSRKERSLKVIVWADKCQESTLAPEIPAAQLVCSSSLLHSAHTRWLGSRFFSFLMLSSKELIKKTMLSYCLGISHFTTLSVEIFSPCHCHSFNMCFCFYLLRQIYCTFKHNCLSELYSTVEKTCSKLARQAASQNAFKWDMAAAFSRLLSLYPSHPLI